MNKTLVITAITITFVMLIGAYSLAPAMAATKLIDIRVINGPTALGAAGFCNGASVFINPGTANFFLVVWDQDNNGFISAADKADVFFSGHGQMVDATGDQIGTWRAFEKSVDQDLGVGGNEQISFTLIFDVVITCEGIGEQINRHSAATFDANGNLRQLHTIGP